MASINVFDSEFKDFIRDGVCFFKLPNDTRKDNENEAEIVKKSIPNELKSLSCSHCSIEFKDHIEQKHHYKSDWHRYNIKKISHSKTPLSLEQFHERLEHSSVNSSSSESESFEEITLQDEVFYKKGQLFLKTSTDEFFSVFKCVLMHKKEDYSEVDVKTRLDKLSKETLICIFLLGGGHFSAAIFQGNEAIKHKTFHCYTVRAGQGRAQGACDNRLASHPKSAGSSLRRYNEQALKQHVGEIISQWSQDIEKCEVILYKASGPYNQSVLFGGKTPVINRLNPKVRGISISTKKATFSEVKRVFRLLTTVTVYESEKMTLEGLLDQKLHLAETVKNNKKPIKKHNNTKLRESLQRQKSFSNSSSSENESVDIELVCSQQNVSFTDSLQEYGNSLSPEESHSQNNQKKRTKLSKKEKLKNKEEQEKKEIAEIIFRGNLSLLKKILLDIEPFGDANEKNSIINSILDAENNVLLHIAAKNEQTEIVKFLLENGANPCLRNSKQQTPYTITQSKEVREVFKDFAKVNPNLFNYNKANIPPVKEVTEEDEERKKALRKQKRDKKKGKILEKKLQAEKEAEEQRFLNLSDREKMALAAERRLASSKGIVTRCFLCAADITGKVPFEYLNNLFCSIECLKSHRYKNSVKLS